MEISIGNQVAKEILRQLGGSKFTVMTGSSKFLFADITETNKNYWLRMNLASNKAKVNRLKIILNGDDTYTMKFYRQTIRNHTDVVITNEHTYDGVYCDMLQDVFTDVTGLYTHL